MMSKNARKPCNKIRPIINTRQSYETSNPLVTKSGKAVLDADSISISTTTLMLKIAVAADPPLLLPLSALSGSTNLHKYQHRLLQIYPSHLSQSRLGEMRHNHGRSIVESLSLWPQKARNFPLLNKISDRRLHLKISMSIKVPKRQSPSTTGCLFTRRVLRC